MRARASGFPLLLLALAAVVAPASAGAADAERVPGTITLSDGTTLTGDIRTTAGKPLTLVENDTGRRLELSLSDIYRVRVRVAEEEQYRVWRWVEDGSREKVYTGESYPRRSYETEVVLRTGQVHRGTLVAVLYVYPEGKKKPAKAILRKDEKGEVGQTLADLVYVESVEFPDAKPPEDGAWAATIALTVTPPEALVTAHAIPRGRDGAVEATKTPFPGAVNFPSLLPGTWDLAVVTPERIFLSLAVGEDGGKPVEGDDLAAIAKRVAEIPDFFETKEVLLAVRDGDRIRAVVRKERTGRTSMEGMHVFRRWEVWTMHRGGDRWLVDDRAYLWREHAPELGAPRKVVTAAALGGVRVEKGIVRVEFAVPEEGER